MRRARVLAVPTKFSQIRTIIPYVFLSFDAVFPRAENKPSSRFQSARKDPLQITDAGRQP